MSIAQPPLGDSGDWGSFVPALGIKKFPSFGESGTLHRSNLTNPWERTGSDRGILFVTEFWQD